MNAAGITFGITALYNDPRSRLAWILRELFRCTGSVFRERKPVSRQTVSTWKQLRRLPEPYEPTRSRREP